MEDPVFAKFMDKKVSPVLGIIEVVDIMEYTDSLEERFTNLEKILLSTLPTELINSNK